MLRPSARKRSTAKVGGSRSQQHEDSASSALKELTVAGASTAKKMKDTERTAAEEQMLESMIKEGLREASDSSRRFWAREEEAHRLGRRNDRMMQWAISNLWSQDADEETRVKQALQNYSREQALACLWESGSLVASASASSDLAADWEHTYWNVLDQEQRKIIQQHFSTEFVNLLNSDLTSRNAPKLSSGAQASERDICCEERAYLMLVIDNIEDEAERKGWRQAYLVMVYGTPWKVTWEEERQRVQDELDAKES